MAQQTAWTSNQVPGSLTVTGNPADTNSHQSTGGRCPRCERMLTEPACPGVAGTFIHLGS
jgi:hypothetical protein